MSTEPNYEGWRECQEKAKKLRLTCPTLQFAFAAHEDGNCTLEMAMMGAAVVLAEQNERLTSALKLAFAGDVKTATEILVNYLE